MENHLDEFTSWINKAIEEYRNRIRIFGGLSKKISNRGGSPILPVNILMNNGSYFRILERDINHQIEMQCPDIPQSYRNELASLAEDLLGSGSSGMADIASIEASCESRIRVLQNILEWYGANRGKKKRNGPRKGMIAFPVDENELDKLSMTFIESESETLLLECGHRKEEKTPAQAGFSDLRNPRDTLCAWDTLRKIAQARGRCKDISKADRSVLNGKLKVLLVIRKRSIEYDTYAREYRTLFTCLFQSRSDRDR